MNLSDIGARIKYSRKKLHMTQEVLAEQINVSPHYIYEIERGSKTMSLHIFTKISKALGVSTDYLLFGYAISDTSPEDELNMIINTLSPHERSVTAKILSTILPFLDMKMSARSFT